jgi:glycosyltransferase involved in cell wall biosynthesis
MPVLHMNAQPKISIGLSVRNGEKTILSAIQSIINQTYTNWELICLDDGSTDNTVALIRGIPDERIKLLVDGQSGGLPQRLNQAIDHSSGDFFARMDADDLALPNRLQLQLDFMLANPQVDLCGGQVYIFNDRYEILGERVVPLKHADITSNYYTHIPIAHPTYFGKMDWFRKFRYRNVIRCEDQDLLLRSFETSCFANLPQHLIVYRESSLDFSKITKGRINFIQSLGDVLKRKKPLVYAWSVVLTYLKVAVDFVAIKTGLNYVILRNRASVIPEDEKAAVSATIQPLKALETVEQKRLQVGILSPYAFADAPSQRFRFEQYLGLGNTQQVDFHQAGYFNHEVKKIIFEQGHYWAKFVGSITGYWRRLRFVAGLKKYDVIYIHREATPIGPPLIEYLIHLFRNKQQKLVYDFDDSIWASDPNRSYLFRLMKWPGKVKHICRWVDQITVGNEFLRDYALQFNKKVTVLPTVVNTSTLHNRLVDQQKPALVVGWTGTFTNLKYLEMIVPIIQQLSEQYSFKFLVIADKDPQFKLSNYQYLTWKKETEIEDLLQFNIGIMPLLDDVIGRGKCGFKAIQYLALGIPAVVSPTGTNKDIVTDSENGYLCSNEAQWLERIETLLKDAKLRSEMGQKGRQKMIDQYSVAATANVFFESLR